MYVFAAAGPDRAAAGPLRAAAGPLRGCRARPRAASRAREPESYMKPIPGKRNLGFCLRGAVSCMFLQKKDIAMRRLPTQQRCRHAAAQAKNRPLSIPSGTLLRAAQRSLQAAPNARITAFVGKIGAERHGFEVALTGKYRLPRREHVARSYLSFETIGFSAISAAWVSSWPM